MEKRYLYKRDTKSKVITVITIIIILAVLGLIILIGLGSYFSAWVLTFIISIISIYILSIPRYIDVRDDCVEIHSVLELTIINIEDVTRVRTLENKKMRGCFPIWGSFGFFGYYGYYIAPRKMELIKIYAGSWSNFVEIMDLYGQKYVVSCSNPQELVDLITSNKANFTAK